MSFYYHNHHHHQRQRQQSHTENRPHIIGTKWWTIYFFPALFTTKRHKKVRQRWKDRRRYFSEQSVPSSLFFCLVVPVIFDKTSWYISGMCPSVPFLNNLENEKCLILWMVFVQTFSPQFFLTQTFRPSKSDIAPPANHELMPHHNCLGIKVG